MRFRNFRIDNPDEINELTDKVLKKIFKEKKLRNNDNFFENLLNFFKDNAIIISSILITIIVVIIAIWIIFAIKNRSRNTKVELDDEIENESQMIALTSVKKAEDLAAEGNYREAIIELRRNFILELDLRVFNNLKALARLTNFEIVAKLEEKDLRNNFKNFSRISDLAMFSDYEITLEHYSEAFKILERAQGKSEVKYELG
ncbi:MAG: hypothetical protein JXR63_12505 [Spirochaetales bacterium]|nr:hypothetical protein [Spirochaetales bacterium]